MLKRLYWSPNSIKILGIDISATVGKLLHDNYDEMLSKVEKILASWSHRKLTIMGKIVVINSLVNTLFVHRLLALPSPGQNF